MKTKFYSRIIAIFLFVTLTGLVEAFPNAPTYDCVDNAAVSMPAVENTIRLWSNDDPLLVNWKPNGVQVSRIPPTTPGYGPNRLVHIGAKEWLITKSSPVLETGSYIFDAFPAYNDTDTADARTYSSRESSNLHYNLWNKGGYVERQDFVSGLIGESRSNNTIFISPLMAYAHKSGIQVNTDTENPRTGISSDHNGTIVSCHTVGYMMPPTVDFFNCGLNIAANEKTSIFNIRFIKKATTYVYPGWEIQCDISNYIKTRGGKWVIDKAMRINVTQETLR